MTMVVGWRVLRNYQRQWLRADLLAGISVGILAIPSVIAYAELAGLPPQTGLVTAVLGMVAYALFGSSKQVIVGPDAAIALLIAAAVVPLAQGDAWRAAGLASLLAMLVGVFLLVAAASRLGTMADFLSKPILMGFMQGAALILVAAQLAKMGKVNLTELDFLPRLYEFASQAARWHLPTLLLGLGLIGVFRLLYIFLPRWPSPLIVFSGLIGVDCFFDLRQYGLAMVGPLPVPELGFALPSIGLSEIATLMPAAIGIVLLAMPEGILLARAFAQRNGDDTDANQELVGIGLANVIAGLLGGFALGASQSRTTLNDNAKAQSQLSGLIAALLMGVFLFFLTPLLNHLPSVAVAALLIHAGLQLVDPTVLRRLFQLDRFAGWFAIMTALGVLVVGIVPGILVGILLSLVRLIHFFSRPYDAMLCRVEDRTGYHDVGEAVEQGQFCTLPGLIVYRFYAPLLFMNVGHFVERVHELLQRHDAAQWVVIDAQAIVDIDVTAVDGLLALHRELSSRGITLCFARCNRPLREALQRFGAMERMGSDVFYAHLDEAIDDFRVLSGQTVTSPQD